VGGIEVRAELFARLFRERSFQAQGYDKVLVSDATSLTNLVGLMYYSPAD